jgi:hypothetical protein
MRLDIPASEIAAFGQQNIRCAYCNADPGSPCTTPKDKPRTVCRQRFIGAVVVLTKRANETKRSPSQQKLLDSLPPVPAEEIEKRRTEKGGYSFSKQWATEQGIPWPLPKGWREAVTRK